MQTPTLMKVSPRHFSSGEGVDGANCSTTEVLHDTCGLCCRQDISPLNVFPRGKWAQDDSRCTRDTDCCWFTMGTTLYERYCEVYVKWLPGACSQLISDWHCVTFLILCVFTSAYCVQKQSTMWIQIVLLHKHGAWWMQIFHAQVHLTYLNFLCQTTYLSTPHCSAEGQTCCWRGWSRCWG